jgi:hypothetical protein
MNAKMDNLVMMVSDVKDRMVVLSDLPQQLQAGFKKLSGDIHSFRKMVLQVRGMDGVGAGRAVGRWGVTV